MTETCIFHLVDILGGLYTCHDTHYRGQKTIYEGWFSFSTVWVLGTELWSSGLLVNTFTYKGNSRALFCFFLIILFMICVSVYMSVLCMCGSQRTIWQWVLSFHHGGSIGCWAWGHTHYCWAREKSIKWDYRSWKNGSAVNSARQRTWVANKHL